MDKIVITDSSGRICRAWHWKLCGNFHAPMINTYLQNNVEHEQ